MTLKNLCTLLSVMIIATASQNVAAERVSGAKRSWDWTLDERLNDRFDPAKIHARNAAYVEAHPQAGSQTAGSSSEVDKVKQMPTITYTIDGARNPELFLPHELFDALLSGLDAGDGGSRQRAFYGRSIRALGYDEAEFWPALESVSASYVAIKSKTCAGTREQGRACVNERCSARFAALSDARRLFGPRQFDRLLYTVVASAMRFSETTTDANRSESLRREEAGCH